MQIRGFYFIAFISLLTIFFGCSSETPGSVTLDENTLLSPVITAGNDNFPFFISNSSDTQSEGFGFLGIFNVQIDPISLTADLSPLRSSSSTDVLEVVDITNFLKIAPCTDCAKIFGVENQGNENYALMIGVRHPFPAGDKYKPISGKNRGDLHVFNVEGIIISDGDSISDYPGIGVNVSNIPLINADGYTPYLDKSIDEFFPTVSDIHPFICHFDDYSSGNYSPSNPMGFASVTDPPPSGNLVMPMGSGYDIKPYIFHLSDGQKISFIYAVGCTYAVSADSKSQRFSPEYRVPQHNKKAASKIWVNATRNDLTAGDTSSSADLQIAVVDINHGVPIGTALNEMLADSSVAEVTVEIPGITSGPVSFGNVPTSGTGHAPLDPLYFDGTVTNTAGGSDGVYQGLVKVLDSYSPGLNQSPLLNGMDGIKRVDPIQNPLTGTFDIPQFATYQVFEISILNALLDCWIATNPDPPEVTQGDTITFDGQYSSGSRPIISYEWDIDFDGFNFDVDYTGVVIDVRICEPGTRDVALRITDESLETSQCAVRITINPDDSAISGWGTDINASDGGVGAEMANMGHRGLAVFGNDIYVVFRDWGVNGTSGNNSQQIRMSRSSDLGLTWDFHSQVTNYASNIEAVSIYQTIWVDRNNGDIYVAYETNGPNGGGYYNGDHDIMITRSTDRGENWEPEVRVNGPQSTGIYGWFPCLTIDDSTNPARLYVSYETYASANYNINVATTTTDSFSNWTNSMVDDSSASVGSYHSVVRVNPIDQSVLVAWVDALWLGGNGDVMFDRSTNHGTSWGTDILINSEPTAIDGPYFPALAINPSTGIPGVLWNAQDGYGSGANAWHKFSKALNSAGSSWGAPVTIDLDTNGLARAGSLDVSSDGHWVALTDMFWSANFTQSQDDGATWSTGVNVADDSSEYDPNLLMDECKNVYVVWKDARNMGTVGATELFFDWAS